ASSSPRIYVYGLDATNPTRVRWRGGHYAGSRWAKISRQTILFCKGRGAALLLARCCDQERGHHFYSVAAEVLMGLVRV
ncbi:unnamed protein product, partial [Ascophyllum nodosum]